MFTVQPDDGASVLVAHEADGAVRWRHPVPELDVATGVFPLRVTELGPVAFVVSDGPAHDLSTTALDNGDGTERWRRSDSRPLRVSGDVAVMLDVDRDVDEQPDGSVRVSESPVAMVGLDVTDGTEQWRRQVTGQHREFGILDDVLVTREADGLTGVDLATGEQLWHRSVAGNERVINATTPWGPAVSQQRRVLSFMPHERAVLARDRATGEVLWQTQLDQLVGHVSTVDDAILARVTDATVVQLEPATGQVRGTITTESDGRPRFLAQDVVVDPETGWVVLVDLPAT